MYATDPQVQVELQLYTVLFWIYPIAYFKSIETLLVT